MNWAGVSGGFELLLLGLREFTGNVDSNRDTGDSSWCVGHLFLYLRGGAGDVDVHGTGRDAHDAEDAAAEGDREQFAGREAGAVAVIVFWRVGDDNDARLRMFGSASQGAFVVDCDFAHCLLFSEGILAHR